MKLIIFLMFISNTAISHEFSGEWTRCEINKNDIEIYITILTQNYRYEIIAFGNGTNCNDIYKTAYAGAFSISKIEIIKDLIIHHRIQDKFISFNENTRSLIGTESICSFGNWIRTTDTRCQIDAEFNPEIKVALLKVTKERDSEAERITIRDNRLYEEKFYKDGLTPSRIFIHRLFP